MEFFKLDFKKESEKALSVFYSTRDKLKALNSRISADSEIKIEQVSRLEEEISSNMELISNNSNIIANINKILG